MKVRIRPVLSAAAAFVSAALFAGNYNVVFDGNGGTAYNEGNFSVTNQVIESGKPTRLLASVFEKGGLDGSVFCGWAETADGPVKYTNCAKVTDLAAEGGTKTLYAVWQTRADRAAGVPSAKKLFPGKWNSVGTSITWYNNNVGYSGGKFTRGYQDRVMDKLIVTAFLNTGISGGCVNGANVQPADLYTLEHGINDWGNNVAPGTLDDYKNKTENNSFAYWYRVAVDKMKANNPKAIVLATPRKGIGFGGYLPMRWDEKREGGYALQDYVNVVLDIAEYEGFEVADNFTFAGDQSTLESLSIEVALHPNDPGYQLMADEVYRAICRALPNMEEIVSHGEYVWTKGASGTWADDDAGWTPRATLVVNEAAELTLNGPKEVSSVSVGGDVTFKGDAISFNYPGTIVFKRDAAVRFENAIGEGWSVTTEAGDASVKSGSVIFPSLPTVPVNVNFGEAVLEGQDLQIEGSALSLTTANGGRIRLAAGSTATLNLDGKAIDFAISGKAQTKPSTYNCLTDGAGATRILDGGELSIGKTLSAWGPQGAGGDIHVEKGGTLKLTTDSSMGIYKPTRVEGGTLVNEYDGWGNILYKVHLSNGAHLTGRKMEAGNNSYYNGSDTAQYSGSFLWQTGTEESLVDFDEIRLGTSTDATVNPVQLKFICDGPLTVASPLTAKEASQIRVNSPEMFGFLKKGADKLTLSSDKTAAPTAALILQAGTVAFPSTAKATFGALVVKGDSTLDIADGAAVSFAASASASWGGRLTLARAPKVGDVRIGTDANGLSSAQLAAISIQGDPTAVLAVDDDGYLFRLAGATAKTIEKTAESATILKGEKTLLFTGVQLEDVIGLSADYSTLHVDERNAGANPTTRALDECCAAGADKAGIYYYANDGTTLTCQFQAKGGAGKSLLTATKLELTQVGADVYGQVVYALYPYDKAYGFNGDTAAAGTVAADYRTTPEDLANSTAWMAVCLNNLRLTVREVSYADAKVTVTYVGKDGETVGTVEANVGTLDLAALAPAAPTYEGYAFTGWDKGVMKVLSDITVTALYEKLCKVTFVDADGTELAVVYVKTGASATAPDMTGKTYKGGAFRAWDQPFNAVTGDLTVTATYALAGVPAEVQNAIESSYFPKGKDALIWGGGASGVWDDGTLNWFTEDGVATAWKAGSIAVFPNSSTVAVVGEKSVAKILNVATAARVVFTGDSLTFTTGEGVRFGANGVFRFENALGGSAGYSQAIGESSDAVLKLASPVYMVSTETRKILPAAAKLANIESFSFALDTHWGSKRTRRVNNDVVQNKEGVYNWTYDPETDSATFLLKALTTEAEGTVITAVKVKLQQEADGIYASVIYVKDALGAAIYGCLVHGEQTTWDCDFDAYDFRRDNGCDLCDEDVAIKNYWVAMYDFACSLKGAIPTEMSVEIAGDCAISGGGGYTLEAGAFRVVDSGTLGGGTFSENVTVNSGALFELAGTAAIEVKGSLTNVGSGRILISGEGVKLTANKGHDWELNISGRATASGYGTLPSGGAGTKVLAGGELSIGEILDYWGPLGDGGPIYVYADGLVRLIHPTAMGVSKPWYLVGGAVANENTASRYPIVYKLNMADGATFTGSRVGVGFTAHYDNWSFINVDGTKSSTFAADDMMVGYQAPATAANHKVGVKFIVADVTGDAAVDFTLESPIVDREGVSLYQGEAVRENCGVWKTGAGTMLLTAATHNEPQGVFKIDAGAIRLGSTCAGKLGALLVGGDSAIEVAEGGCIAFEDSASVAWASDATLTIRGQAKSRSIRIGTSADALTADQLVQIRYESASGVQKPVTIDANGYLRFESGFRLIVR